MTVPPTSSTASTDRAGLYAIVDTDALGARDALAFGDKLLAAGALFALQLRAKRSASRAVLALGRALAWRCARAGVPFYLNDRADLAVLANATGVHVGQDDLTVREARGVGPGLLVGRSTHNDAQATQALADGADYVAFGPVFATGSKARPDPVVGPEALARVVARAGAVPVVAIGGITLERASVVRASGARAGAVIAALVGAHDDDVTRVAREIHRALGGT